MSFGLDELDGSDGCFCFLRNFSVIDSLIELGFCPRKMRKAALLEVFMSRIVDPYSEKTLLVKSSVDKLRERGFDVDALEEHFDIRSHGFGVDGFERHFDIIEDSDPKNQSLRDIISERNERDIVELKSLNGHS